MHDLLLLERVVDGGKSVGPEHDATLAAALPERVCKRFRNLNKFRKMG